MTDHLEEPGDAGAEPELTPEQADAEALLAAMLGGDPDDDLGPAIQLAAALASSSYHCRVKIHLDPAIAPDIELCMNATDAATIAEVLHHDRTRERWTRPDGSERHLRLTTSEATALAEALLDGP